MSGKSVTKIEKFNYDSVITLNQQVTEKRYLTFDLWEECQSTYNQILLQINNLYVLNIVNGTIYFDLTDRQDVIDSMSNIENHLIKILKNYLAKINKRGNFSFASVIKLDSVNNQSKPALALNIMNDDYDINFYDHTKTKVDSKILRNQQTKSSFNIIIEIMYIHLDMIKGSIVVDTRLRMVMENRKIIKPQRSRITEVDDFIEIESDSETYEPLPTVDEIQQSFDVTQTEMFYSDNESEHLDHDKNKDQEILSEAKSENIIENLDKYCEDYYQDYQNKSDSETTDSESDLYINETDGEKLTDESAEELAEELAEEINLEPEFDMESSNSDEKSDYDSEDEVNDILNDLLQNHVSKRML